jgi:hypothetical protein
MSKAALKEIEILRNRTMENGFGYGDPDARRDDDRKLQTLIAEEQIRIGWRMNTLTAQMAFFAFLQVVGLAIQIWGK